MGDGPEEAAGAVMNLLVAWKKVALFGLFGAVGCLAGWLVGEPYLLIAREVMKSTGAKEAPSLISTPTPVSDAPLLPDDIRERVEKARGKSGDVQISLIWYNLNDLDLHCKDPNGEVIYYKNKRVRSGGELDVDMNAGDGRTPLTREPVENIYWPKDGAPPGRYEVFVNYFAYRPEVGARNATNYKVNVLHDGKRHEFEGAITNNGSTGNLRRIYEFELAPRLEIFAPSDIKLAAGKASTLRVAVRRTYYSGPIEIKAENLPEGVTVGVVTIPTGKEEGELELRIADGASQVKKPIKFVAVGDKLSVSTDAQLEITSPGLSLWAVLSAGVWTALLAVGLCLALVVGQNYHLKKPLFASGRVPLVLVVIGAVVAGFVSGSIGQMLFFVFFALGVGKLGMVLGWMLLGVLLGAGVSFFVPNLDVKKSALAGLGGGLLGAIAFLVLPSDLIGRFGGAALLGFCIGLMVAVVEVAFRRAWLEVRFSEREIITVNLGPEPVKVGGDARACTVWARGAPEIAFRYFIRNGQVICNDVVGRSESVATNGDTRAAGSVTVVVRTGNTPLAAGSATPARPVPPPRPALPAPPAPPAASPAKPQVAPAPAPAQSKPAQPDYDDGLPMPMGPPPPARIGATSILDIDDLRATAAAKPQAAPAAKPAPAKSQAAPAPVPAAKPPAPPAPVAKSMAPPAPKPPVPAVAKSMAPPAPAAKSMAPPAPKPPVPGATAAGGPKPGDPEACPTCGRKSPGKPGSRYCMVCDRTF